MKMNKKGSILMISLWILAILVVFALGLGHRAMINLQLAKYQRDRLKAACLAKAGINRAIVELENDLSNPNTKDYDSLNETWSTGKDNNGNLIFKNVEIIPESGETFTVSITDEERKININKIDDIGQKQILEVFLSDKIEPKLDPIKAQSLTNTIINWIDNDQEPIGDTIEDSEIFKNALLRTSEELLLISEYFYKDKEEAKKVYDVAKDLITVYGDNKININTSSLDVLKIVITVVGADPNIQATPAEIQDLVSKIDNYRKGDVGYFTITDMNADEIKIKLSLGGEINNQTKIIDKLVSNQLLAAISKNFRIESTGNVGKTSKTITVIVNRGKPGEPTKTIYWHEN